MSAIFVCKPNRYSGRIPTLDRRTMTRRLQVSHGEPRPPRQRRNRILQLWKERGWTAAEVAERVSQIAVGRGEMKHSNTVEVTINRLSSGAMKLNEEWLSLFSELYGVPATEILAPPPAAGMRRVRVKGLLRAGHFAESQEWPESEQYDVMVPDDDALHGIPLYAGEIADTSMNRRYPMGTIVIISPLLQLPGEIAEGRRYHVRRRNGDATEEAIRTLTRDKDGRFWLRPESDDPEHQQWIAFDARGGGEVTLAGRVRGVFIRED